MIAARFTSDTCLTGSTSSIDRQDSPRSSYISLPPTTVISTLTYSGSIAANSTTVLTP